MSAIESVALLSSLLSIVSVPFGVIQFFRYRVANDALQAIKSIKKQQIWGNIQQSIVAFDALEDARQLCLDPQAGASAEQQILLLTSKVSSARRSVVGLYLNLLQQAINEESSFTEADARRWRQSGKLENDWRLQKALQLCSS